MSRRKGITYAEHIAIAKAYRQALHDLRQMTLLLAARYGVTSKPYKALWSIVQRLQNQPRSTLDGLEFEQAIREGVVDHQATCWIYYDSPLTKPDGDPCEGGDEWLLRKMKGGE